MKIAIHQSSNDFSSRWIAYCRQHGISYKLVNCYDDDIIEQLHDCDGLMWHFSQLHVADVLFAKQLIFAVQAAGKSVFPDVHTSWFFDDKVAQKYLLEALQLPLVPSYVFYDKAEALAWIATVDFPKVFKLRRGAGSAHVKIVPDKTAARKLIHKAFGSGFSQYDKMQNLKDRWYHYQTGKGSAWDVLKGVLRFARTTHFARTVGPEKGYVYFQDFIPGNSFDIRVIVIDGKSFAIKRMVRNGDFRASGSGHVHFEKHHFSEKLIALSFDMAEKLKSQCLAVDYIFNGEKAQVVELSYGFIKEVYYKCEGYWDRSLHWHEGPFDAQAWMVEALLKKISRTDTAPLAETNQK